jgi:hypothetical protein
MPNRASLYPLRFGDEAQVLSFCDVAQSLVARLAERLGLPCNSSKAVDTARDKKATRNVLKAAGLPTPKNYLIKCKADVEAAAAAVGFPAGACRLRSLAATNCVNESWWFPRQTPGVSFGSRDPCCAQEVFGAGKAVQSCCRSRQRLPAIPPASWARGILWRGPPSLKRGSCVFGCQ